MTKGNRPDTASAAESNRRIALLRAAAKLFVDKGFDATTTRDIANAVGMRSGSPFYHFRSKQELLKAAIADGLETARQRMQEAIADIVDPEQRLRTMIRTHLSNLLDGACQAPLLLYESRSLDPAARAEIGVIADHYQRPWQTTLEELAAEGKLRTAAPPVRLFLFGMLNWSKQWFRPDGALSIDELSDSMCDMLLVPTDKN